MDDCLIECQNSINIFLAMMIYLAALVLVVFFLNRFAARKSRYGGSELALLTNVVFPSLILLKVIWGVSIRLDVPCVLLLIGSLGGLRFHSWRKEQRAKQVGV